jgi:hypothetical protein
MGGCDDFDSSWRDIVIRLNLHYPFPVILTLKAEFSIPCSDAVQNSFMSDGP